MKKGFTLIELMLVIIILGILVSLITGNFLNSLNKGRDARRKGDLEQVQKALEFYYEDQKAYPASLTFGSPFTYDTGSGVKTYMTTLPTDPSGHNYKYCISGNKYQLYAYLENSNDPTRLTDLSNSLCGAANTKCFGINGDCNYGIANSVTSP